MKIKPIAVVIAAFFLITSCNSEKGDKNDAASKPAAGGRTLEVIVVVEDQIWKGIVGDAIKDYFGQEQPGLGQSEPMFDVRHLPPEKFSDLFRKYRNILLLETSSNKKKAAYKANVWAQPQHIVSLKASNRQDLVKLINKEKEKIRELFYIAERKRIKNAYKRLNQNDIVNKLRKELNIEMVIPKGFYLAKLRDNFAWLRREPAEYSQGILIYTQPYLDTMQFTPDRIIEARDSVTKKHIPGPIDGSYMKTEKKFRPFTRDIKFNGEFATEIRGLWRTEKAFMGGPFLSITTYDEKNQRLLTLEGFVYHPNEEKRNYLMQLDAILHSVKFIDEDKKEKADQKNS